MSTDVYRWIGRDKLLYALSMVPFVIPCGPLLGSPFTA